MLRASIYDWFLSRWRNYHLRRLMRRVPGNRRRNLGKLVDVYQKLDDDLSRFRHKTGMGCLEGCGKCCESPKVETTVFEMLPVALSLWESGEAEKVLTDLETLPTYLGTTCRMYRPDPERPGKGRCSVYMYRPLLCRLFGYTARMRKDQTVELITCRLIKEHRCQTYNAACQTLREQKHLGVMVEPFARRVRDLAGEGDDTYPINEALRRALAYTGMLRGYADDQKK